MGSVKDLEVIQKPTKDKMGTGKIPLSATASASSTGAKCQTTSTRKGAALCLMGAYCFERLEEKSVRTHYRGLVDENGKAVAFNDLKTAKQHHGSLLGQRLQT